MKKVQSKWKPLLAYAVLGSFFACANALAADVDSTSIVVQNGEMQSTHVVAQTIVDTRDAGDAGAPGFRGNTNHGPNVKLTEEEQALIQSNYKKFKQKTFTDAQTGIKLQYNLYVPAHYDKQKQYPLVMFIPDATGAGKTPKQIAKEYYGANVWVTEETQQKEACFVLVPAFSEVVVNDKHNTSEEIEVAVRLLHSLTDTYSIDTNRLYTTGQSMGCMTSMYLNSKYPDLFAASIFVSGQWDINVLKPLESKKFFYIVAGGDSKASAGQKEVMDMFDADGVSYSHGVWSARDAVDVQNMHVRQLANQNMNANMVTFEKGTVLNGQSDMEHMASFNYAYALEAVRDWLFLQSK